MIDLNFLIINWNCLTGICARNGDAVLLIPLICSFPNKIEPNHEENGQLNLNAKNNDSRIKIKKVNEINFQNITPAVLQGKTESEVVSSQNI